MVDAFGFGSDLGYLFEDHWKTDEKAIKTSKELEVWAHSDLFAFLDRLDFALDAYVF